MTRPPGDSASKPAALFLAPEAPYPVIGGGPLRTASLLEYLAARYSVHLIVFRQPGDPDPARAIPTGKGARIDVIDLPFHSKHGLARIARNSARLARGAPPLMDRFAGFERQIAAAIGSSQYSTAVIEHFWCAPYCEQIRPHAKQVILDLHNIESAWHQSLAASSGPPKASALRRFATASVAMERKWLPRFDAILVTSTGDASTVRELAPGAQAAVYPNALPLIAAPPRQDCEEIVFSGNLEYAPNVDAVRFFAKQIWPSLRAHWPNLQWKILGKNPHAVENLVHGDARIVLTGFVENAIEELARARVAVVPLLAGSGTRIKILEAWAAATPVVSTTIGAEGLDVISGEQLVIADDPARFIAVVSHLLSSDVDRARIGQAGRRFYEQRYTWPVAWRALDAIFGNPAPKDPV